MKEKTIDLLKNILPYKFYSFLNNNRKNLKNLFLFKKDRAIFLRNYSRVNSNNSDNLKARIIFYSHSLEKGLSHEPIRLGFGVNVLNSLLTYMKRYKSLGFEIEDKAYLSAQSAIKEYIQLHEKHSFVIDYITKENQSLFHQCKDVKSELGGVQFFSNMQDRASLNFKELSQSRHSVRDYDKSSVDINLIKSSIEIATKTPSVCNRQSCRVYVISDPMMISNVLKIQGGFKNYPMPPCLLLITTDTRYFIDITERNQVYIEGGLFSMSLLYALEYNNLAACALNTMFDNKRLVETKKVLKIPEYENLIMYIAIGNFKKNYKTPKSFRISESDITQYIS